MKGTYVHIKSMFILRVKQLCNSKVPDFAMALQAQRVSGAFEKHWPQERERFYGKTKPFF